MSLSAMGWLQTSLGVDVTGEWSQVLNLNVGGVGYTCIRKTLLKHAEASSIFSSVLSGTARKAEDGSFIIDRDGMIFRHILNFLRTETLILPDRFDEWDLLLDDARYYQLPTLESAIIASFQFQRRNFRKALPLGILVKASLTHQEVVPALPSLTVEKGSFMFQDKAVPSLEYLLMILSATYAYKIDHWRSDINSKGEKEERIFLSLNDR